MHDAASVVQPRVDGVFWVSLLSSRDGASMARWYSTRGHAIAAITLSTPWRGGTLAPRHRRAPVEESLRAS